MYISLTDQINAGIDYFATDAAGQLLHVATGIGGSGWGDAAGMKRKYLCAAGTT